VGEPAPLYLEARPAHIGINATYEPIVYTRPVVTVEPPSMWIGVRPGFAVVAPAAVIVDDHPGRHRGHQKGGVVVGGGAVVSGGVSVSVPVPSVSVGVHIGGPAVMIGGGGHAGHGKFKHKKFKRRK
jgi:hypothetical protein